MFAMARDWDVRTDPLCVVVLHELSAPTLPADVERARRRAEVLFGQAMEMAAGGSARGVVVSFLECATEEARFADGVAVLRVSRSADWRGHFDHCREICSTGPSPERSC